MLNRQLVALIACSGLVVSGCGGGHEPVKGRSSDESPPSTTVAGEFSETDDCRLAGLAWQRAARDHINDAAFEVPFDDPDARNESTDRVEVYCSKELLMKVLEANYEFALLNAGLAVCQSVPANCDPAGNTAQSDKLEPLVSEVSDLIDAKA